MAIKPLAGSHKAPLQPLPPPNTKWSQISSDFITDLPTSKNGNDAICTVVDSLSKIAHFIPCKKTITAERLAELFKSQIWKLHGILTVIISDRDPKFTSKVWTAFTQLLGIKQAMSTAFHLETDGQTERCQRTIEQILRYYVCYKQTTWEEYLDQAEFAYNQAKHSTAGHSPFFAMYGYQPTMDFPNIQEDQNKSATVLAKRMKDLKVQLRTEIAKMQQKQKHYADLHQKMREFETGEWVWLNTGNLKFRFLSKKLAPRFVGPFQIIYKISAVAYELKLPQNRAIYDVFYVGLLRQHKGPIPDDVTLPVLIPNEAEEYEVEAILRYRIRQNKYSFLVLWKRYPPSEATWQNQQDLNNAPRILMKYCAQNAIAL